MRFKALLRVITATVVGVLLGSLPALAKSQESIEAVWVPRQTSFVYQGFTTHYSCGGLRDKIRHMLSKLGARHLEVREQGCIRLVGPEPFPGVRVSMQVLVPVSSEQGKKTGPVIAAHWENVVLMPSNASIEEQGNCELIEQFKETLLPLFATRDISFESNCVPHQLTLGTHLSAEVLVPDVKPARAR
jgi:hypothetical protein